jgi:hypothetical protein
MVLISLRLLPPRRPDLRERLRGYPYSRGLGRSISLDITESIRLRYVGIHNKLEELMRKFTDFEYHEYTTGVRSPLTWMQIRCKIDGKRTTLASFSGASGIGINKNEAKMIVAKLNQAFENVIGIG